MAASDKPFHNQRTLDIVFAVSNILMLLSTVWMFAQDYYREYKTEQRIFRNVEVAVAQRQALDSIPSKKEFDDAEASVIDLKEKRETRKDELASARAALIGLRPDKERAEASFQTVKADVESFTSLRDIAIEHGDTELKKKYDDLLADRNAKLAEVQAKRDEVASKMKAEQLKIDEIQGKLTKAVAEFKKVNDRFDSQVKLALNKRWGFGDWFRTQPVINGFADPLKIQQFTIDTIPIDYNFKKVTRFDRCMSCHVGIDRPAFTRANLEALTKDDANSAKLEEAKKLYERRVKALDSKDAAIVPNPGDMSLVKLSPDVLTPARVTEFCAHPRLDLYVGSNSKHPAEKFGCTSCHSGQGSGTSFVDASHSPNSMAANKKWTDDRGWEFNHMWDFPMHSRRFVESSCLKCHYEVTDLISSDNRVEAPKLLRGHQLIRENGCFGCHEISGYKSGQRVGPDMRLEPNPPLEELTPSERQRAESDPDNRPGNLRKVGPALTRVSEKVRADWIEKWLRSPSAFRPDTKMPHYYGLSNNLEGALPEEQKKFPNTEIASIAHFLTATSKTYLADAAKHHKDDAKVRQQDQDRLLELLNRGRLDEKEQAEFAKIKERIKLRKEVPLEDLAPNHKGDADKGRLLFTERGCLACHTHQGTEVKTAKLPAISSEAVFGPNLSQVAEKFTDKAQGRKWLIQWILDPHVHSPRSRMPVTHLTPQEAADLAAWLLAQPSTRDESDPWLKIEVAQPTKQDLQDLARVYLTRMMSKSDMERYLKGDLKGVDWDVVEKDVTKDEMRLKDKVDDEGELKFYLGKKAVSRLGCFGCHDIPGFENTKPIGVGLNDWGKKAPDRLAFEDIDNFFKAHYQSEDADGIKDGKEPYDPYYKEALMGHFRQREGYLNQKIRDPRSYDYNRIRAWDDRARMPKFTLGRPRIHQDEEKIAFQKRIFKEEAEAREAVATFVLGLVAEQVPVKSVNQPTGERLAEVRGRQVLDKYNCAGCHTIRPGVYDFKAGPKTLDDLETRQSREWEDLQTKGEFNLLNHHNWVGRNPTGLDRLTLYGSQPKYDDGTLLVRLNEALRFVGKDKSVKNIPAGVLVEIAAEDLTANPAALKTQADFNQRFQAVQPYGGAFTELMVPWLIAKESVKYKPDGAAARASLPPTLVGQGERTQPDWLYQFLLNPTKVRSMTVLRMPQFNMSREEANILRDYFAAVTRLTNPGIGLEYPSVVMPSRENFTGDYWRKKTADYISHLQNTKDKTGKKLYDVRLEEYKPLWTKIREERSPELKASIERLQKLIDDKTAEKKTKTKAAADEKDADKKEGLQKEITTLTSVLETSADEKARADKSLANLDVDTQKKLWESEEAYASDAFRLLTSRELCTKCHQVGNFAASEKDQQGPPLDLASVRLRPDWIERWVNKPQRFLPYASIMPPYFNRHEMKYQELYAGGAQEQIDALRDALMNYPRLSSLPVNRLHNPSQPAPAK